MPQWLGDLPTWITTVAVLIAAGQYLGERRRRREEAERESREQASHLTAWTVTDASHERKYGVRLSNTSGSAFHSVHIEAVIHGNPAQRPIQLMVVPPGDYFVEFESGSPENP